MNRWNYHNYEYIINENLILVYLLVDKMNVPYQNREILLQAGFRGLIQAVRLYDLQKNCNFAKFAIPIILQAIKKSLRKVDIQYDETWEFIQTTTIISKSEK